MNNLLLPVLESCAIIIGTVTASIVAISLINRKKNCNNLQQVSTTTQPPNFSIDLYKEIDDEIGRASMHGKQFVSLHEAYAVIFEELDEIWDITRLKRKHRAEKDLHDEFIQLAAMSIKALNSMENFIGGDV
jgi:hypothetical protein